MVPKPKRRWFRSVGRFQFSLSALLLFSAAISVWLSVTVSPIKKQEQTLEILKRFNSRVVFDYEFPYLNRGQLAPERPRWVWLHRLFGDTTYDTVQQVLIIDDAVDNEAILSLSGLIRPSQLQIVAGSKLTDAGLESLKQLTHLEHFEMRAPSVTGTGLYTLARLSNLKELGLTPSITDTGLSFLASIDQLESLELFGNPITDEGVSYLTKLPSLRHLSLQDTNLTDVAVKHLKGMTGLRFLDVSGTRMTPSAIKELRDGHFVGRRFEFEGLSAVWMLDSAQIRLFDRCGKLILTYIPGQEDGLRSRAA